MKKELTPTSTKGELLQDEHTKGIWFVEKERVTNEHGVTGIEISTNGLYTNIATIWGGDTPEEMKEAQANADLICKLVNSYGLPQFFPNSSVPIPSNEYIERAVNNYQSLVDALQAFVNWSNDDSKIGDIRENAERLLNSIK